MLINILRRMGSNSGFGDLSATLFALPLATGRPYSISLFSGTKGALRSISLAIRFRKFAACTEYCQPEAFFLLEHLYDSDIPAS